jgi:hypothetical protein
MRAYVTMFRAATMVFGTLLLQPNQRPSVKLPGFRIRMGMGCPIAGCGGKVVKRNAIMQCNRCYTIIEPE